MPVEALYHWLGEEVGYHHCHASAEELIERVEACRVGWWGNATSTAIPSKACPNPASVPASGLCLPELAAVRLAHLR